MKNFLISLLIHLSVLIVGILLLRSRTSDFGFAPPTPKTLYAVIEGPEKAASHLIKSKPSLITKSPAPVVPLSKLGLPKNLVHSQSDDSSRGSEKSGQAQNESGLSLEEATKERPFLSALYERIQNDLTYPSELVDAKKTGSIRVSFKVDRQGKLTSDFFNVDAEDRFLKVHIFRTIRKALEAPLSVSLKDREDLTITATFNFSVAQTREDLPDLSRDFMNNSLLFQRVSLDPNGTEIVSQGLGLDNKVHVPDDASAPILRQYSFDKNGIFTATSNSGNQSIVMGIDPIKLYQWIFGKSKSGFDPLERYKLDPDY